MKWIKAPLKRCLTCGEDFPETTYYFKRRYKKPGYEDMCKECLWHPERRKFELPKSQSKRCSECKQEYPSTPEYFHRRQMSTDGLSNVCKNCKKNRSQNCVPFGALLSKTPKRRARLRASKKAMYQKYRARKLSLPDTFSDLDWIHALEYFDGCCAVCGRPQGLWHILAADHWIPLVSPDCTGTVPTNIIPLCHGVGGCNNLKGKQDPEQWLLSRYPYRKAKAIIKRIQTYFDTLT